MDFTKLNTEFANMQTTIVKYHNVVSKIESKIKYNSKLISKYETKGKKLNNIEKELSNLYIKLLKHENDFLKTLITEDTKSNNKIER